LIWRRRPGGSFSCATGSPRPRPALYLRAGFTVVCQDIVIGPALSEVAGFYAGYPLSVFVLCPRPEVVAARDAARGKTGYTDAAMVRDFDRVLREETPRLGFWLDTSDLTVRETAERLLFHFPRAHVVPGGEAGSATPRAG
jgi:hypothetical protein